MKPRIPWVTLLLVAANILPAFGLLFDPDIADRLGFHPMQPALLTAATSMFLHLNVVHLLGNMVFLAAVGPWVEFAAGAWRFLTIYLVGGLVGCFTHWIFARQGDATSILIGASGAVAACVGYASVRYFAVPVPLSPGVRVPVWGVAAAWVALQVLGALVRIGDPEGGVAFWNHLGGFVAGVLLSLVFRAQTQANIDSAHRALEHLGERSPAAVLAACEQHLARHPNDIKALREKADALALLDDREQEGQTRLRIAELCPDPDLPRAVLELGRCEPRLLQRLPALKRLRDAERMRGDEPEAAELLLRSVAQTMNEPLRPDALLDLAMLIRERDPAEAERLLQVLDDEYPLHPAADRARTRGLLR